MTPVKSRRHAIDILFILALFCVLAASSLFVVMIGVNVYEDIVVRMNDNYDARTTLTYLSEKVRQHDSQGAVYLDSFGDSNALVLEQETAGDTYQTLIYLSKGELKELFVSKDYIPSPEDGETIMSHCEMSIEQTEDGLLFLSIKDSKEQEVSLILSPRCAV